MDKFSLIAVLIGALLVTSDVRAGDEICLPDNLPPVIGTAWARETADPAALKPDKNLVEIVLSWPHLRWEILGQTKSKQEWPKVVVAVEKRTKTLRFDTLSQLNDSRVVGIDGKDLSHEEMLKRLARETPVLVSVTGKMVESYYLQLTKSDAVIVILGPRDGFPAPELLPAPKSET